MNKMLVHLFGGTSGAKAKREEEDSVAVARSENDEAGAKKKPGQCEESPEALLTDSVIYGGDIDGGINPVTISERSTELSQATRSENGQVEGKASLSSEKDENLSRELLYALHGLVTSLGHAHGAQRHIVEHLSSYKNSVDDGDKITTKAFDDLLFFARSVCDDLGDFLNGMQEQREARGISPGFVDSVSEYRSVILREVDSGAAMSLLRIRQTAASIQRTLRKIQNGERRVQISRTKMKNLSVSARDLEILACRYEMERVAESMQFLQNQVRGLMRRAVGNDEEWGYPGVYGLSHVIKEVVEQFGDAADRRDIDIQVRDRASEALVRASAEELKMALGNLLDNAVKYTGELPEDSHYEKPWIKILIASQGDLVEASFESWGVPVTKEELSNGLMFKEGFRGRFARQADPEGTGIGLTDVKRFAEALGGDVIFDTKPVAKSTKFVKPTKTTVTIVLPVCQDVESYYDFESN